MSSIRSVLNEFDSCLSYYPIISFAIILGLSVNFIYSIDIFYKDPTSMSILPGNISINTTLSHSLLTLTYLAITMYLSFSYLTAMISIRRFINELNDSNITVLTDIKDFIRLELFNKFALRATAIIIALCIVFSKSLITSCDNYCNIFLIDNVHYIYAFIFLIVIILIEYPTFTFLSIYSKHLYIPSTPGEYTRAPDIVRYFLCDFLHHTSRRIKNANLLFMACFAILGLTTWRVIITASQ